ncbi:MAG TPA: alpha/beta hydrolase [Blastocatellia bacterium]|nr:alpha/beta hydrolase [Blastocatellia bacterium]
MTGDSQNGYRVEGTGPVLIYVPGLDGTGQLFFKQGPRLSSSHRVVTFRSRDDGRFTYKNLTDDLAAIIRDLGEQQAIILGESFGGTVALWFALRYPQMVKQLVVINSFPRFRKRLTIKLGVKLASGVPFRLLWPVRRAASILGLLVDAVDRDDRKRFWNAIRTVSGEAYRRRLKLIEELDLEPRLSEIQTPTLLIAGDRDLLIPSVKEAHVMAARMPNARVKVIEGAGHACLMGSRVRLDELLAE